MKNLTHYFQLAKSPSEEAASGSNVSTEETAESKEKTRDEDISIVSSKSPAKPKKLSLKSRKSQQDSKSDGNSTPKIASPDSTVDTSEKKTRRKRSESSKTSEKMIKNSLKGGSPQKTFKTSMQDILQKVLKKKFPDGEYSLPDLNNKTTDEAASMNFDLDETDEDVKLSEEISSSITPKKRGRKPKNAKKESNTSPGKNKLSYEELETELLKERLLLQKLKETFLASNPDEESLAKYNSTLSPKNKLTLNNSSLSNIDKCELLSTPKSGRRKLSNGIGVSKSAENKPKSPKKSLSSTPKSLPPKGLTVLKKSNLTKKTPENDTKIMKEVLEFLDHSESKSCSPSPKKSSPGSKQSEGKDKSASKSKKQLEFADVKGKNDSLDKVKKKKKKVGELAMPEKKNGTPEKANKKKKENGDDGTSPVGNKKPKNSPKKSVTDEKNTVLTESPLDVKRKRKQRTDSTDGPEKSFTPVSPGKKKVKISLNSKEKLELEPSSPPKKKKTSFKSGGDVSNELHIETSTKAKRKSEGKSQKGSDFEEIEKPPPKKRGRPRKSEESKSTQKESIAKESEKSVSSQGKIDKDQKQKEETETIDLNSSSDSVFIDASQKSNDGTKSVKPKSESDNEEKRHSQTKSSEESSQKNSLFKYFGKVDKTYMKKEERSSCLTTRAIIHSPPVSPSKKRKSTEPPFSPRRKKLKTMLVDADKIELLSSEVVPNTEFENSNDSDSEVTKTANDRAKSKGKSPKKWSMRVKLAVQSPSKPTVTDSKSPESSPESKVKRKLFGSQQKSHVKDSDEGSTDSHDVEVIEEKASCPKVKGSEVEKVSNTSKDESAKTSASTVKESETPKPPVKLASIFLKKSTPKVNTSNSTSADSPIVIDDETLQAKKEFLSSGVPDIIKQKTEQLKAQEKSEEEYYVPFPKISHVGYDNTLSQENALLELGKSFKLRPDVDLLEIVNDSLKEPWKNLIDPAVHAPMLNENISWPKCNDSKRQTRYLKKQASNFPFEVFEKKLEKISSADKSSEVKHEMWTEKYKPQSSQEVLGNGSCVSELKRWLEEQKASKKKDLDESSGDEFVSSDDDSSLTKCANNVAIISGPPGCGKTSSVYAVAKELGCQVLELNASCNRNGKKVLSELLEATQSHQVKRVSNILADMFSKAAKGDKKKKKKKLKSKDPGLGPDAKVMSIILIEDADLIFSDHDDGFIAALSSLSTMSKRPVILVSNSIQCSHLNKFIKQQCLLLEFSKPSFFDMRTFLQLIALSEMVELPKEDAERIVYETRDLRQAMLTLQYHLISTFKPQTDSEVGWPLDIGKLWWQWPLPLSISPLTIKTVKKSMPSHLDPSNEKTNGSEELVSGHPAEPSIPSHEDCLKFHKLASFIDNLAVAEVWSSSRYHTIKSEDPSPKAWHVNATDSCLLNERTNHEHAGHDSLSVVLSHEFISRNARYLDMKLTNCVQNGLSPDLVRWKKKLRKVEEILLTGLPIQEQIERESIFCDYLPMIRSISRSECVRLAGNSKRSNRFFNYLSSLNMHPDESQRTLMCNSFVVMNETKSSS
nr:PREDICTED: ATPase family AAA domain-containing protein 5 [Bemisia tabaci]